MAKKVIGESIGDMSDLTTPSSTRKYALGKIVTVEDDDYQVRQQFIYVKSHTTLTAYQPYVLNYGSTAGAEVVTAAPLTNSAPGSQVVVPQVAFTSGYYGFVQIEGDCKALMTTETYALGDILQLVTAATTLVVDGSTGSTTWSTGQQCAICREAGSTAVARKIYLIHKLSTIAAS